MFTIEDAFNVCLERVDYWGEVRNKNFAPEGTYFGRRDMFVKAMVYLDTTVPLVVTGRPKEDRPRNKIWYYRLAKPEEYTDYDKAYFTKEIFTKAIDELLEPMANLNPDEKE